MKTLKYYCYILLTIGLYIATAINYSSAQSKHRHTKSKARPKSTYKDSIKLEASADIDSTIIAFKNKKTTYAEVVKFTLKITNGSSVAVPDPIAYKGSKFVKLYINGKLKMPKALFDESEDLHDTYRVIASGHSQTFYCDWLKSNRTQLMRQFGKKFTIQFAYLNKRSAKVLVNVNKLKLKPAA